MREPGTIALVALFVLAFGFVQGAVSDDSPIDMCGSCGDAYMRSDTDGSGFGPASGWGEDDDGCGGPPNLLDPCEFLGSGLANHALRRTADHDSLMNDPRRSGTAPSIDFMTARTCPTQELTRCTPDAIEDHGAIS